MLTLYNRSFSHFKPYPYTRHQITAPLIPKIKGAGDTRHFQEYEENGNVFKIKTECVHAKEFEDF